MLPELKPVAEELASTFVSRDACRWISETNAGVGGPWPLELRAIDPAALRQAARAERYAALG